MKGTKHLTKEQVLQKLAILADEEARIRDPILVQLNSCKGKDAFLAGEMVERAFYQLERSAAFVEERILPTAGLIMPPLV